MMRVLIISYFFPPYNSIGALRVGKTAKYLNKLGIEIKVLTALNQNLSGPLAANLILEIPEDSVTYTEWLNLSRIPRLLSESIFKRESSNSNFRNGHIGWLPFAYKAANLTLRFWKPDLIYASAMPSVSLITAYLLSKKHNIPWVAEMRDLWVDSHYIRHRGWRKRLEEILEERILSSTAGIVTVSEPLAEVLFQKYKRPTKVILNGFDPDDYPNDAETHHLNNTHLSIVYTGKIYEGKQNPIPLFKALQLLNYLSDTIRIHFYGPDFVIINKLADEYGLNRIVVTHPPVSHKEALEAQQESDILLLLLWEDTCEKGVYTGKLFEYIGAGRPILGIGPRDNVAADLICERLLGAVLTTPEQIAEQLIKWIEQKRHGGIPDIPREGSSGLSRPEQSVLLEKFLSELLPRG